MYIYIYIYIYIEREREREIKTSKMKHNNIKKMLKYNKNNYKSTKRL